MKALRIILTCVAIILFILAAILATGHTMFKRQVQKEIVQLFADSEDISGRIFTYDQIQALPEPVQRYFRYALRDGQNYISYARLKHTGTFRTSPDQEWMPISGQEYFTTHKPGFVWFARVKPFPLLWITARDTYYQGKGNVLIKLYSTITLGNAKGKEVNQGALLTFLAEAAWYPTALLPGEKLQWEAIDGKSAKILFSDSGIDISAMVHFNETGEIIRLTAERYRDISLEKWTGYYQDYREMDGVRVPAEVEVVWNLDSGDLSYAMFKITEIEFNTPSIYK